MPVELDNTLLKYYTWIVLAGGLGCLIHYAIKYFANYGFRKKDYSALNQLKPWNISWPIFILFFGILLIVLSLLTSLIMEGYSWWKGEDTSESQIPIFIQGFFLPLSVLVTILIYGFQFPQSGFFAFNLRRLSFQKKCSIAIYYFLLSIPLLVFLQLILKKSFEYWDLNLPPQKIIEIIAQTQSVYALALMIFMIVILAPLTEEILFRGIIYRFLKGKIGPLFGAMISAFIFALAHTNLFSFIPLFVLGLLLTLSYEHSGNITVPILFHAFFNTNSMIFILFHTTQQ